MLICPKCKVEYQEGCTTCSDCGEPLVDSENVSILTPIYFSEKAELIKICRFLEFNQITSGIIKENENDTTFELFVAQEEEKKAKKCLQIFLKQKQEADAKKDKVNGITTMQETLRPAEVYEDAAEKAKDYRGTAWMLIVIGLAGIVIDNLMLIGKFPIVFGGSTKYITYGVMAVMFIAFLAFGINALHSAKLLASKADREKKLMDEVKEWAKENLTKESLDAYATGKTIQTKEEDSADKAIDKEDTSIDKADETVDEEEDDNILYFQRTDLMKQLIEEKFGKISETVLEEIVEELYDTF